MLYDFTTGADHERLRDARDAVVLLHLRAGIGRVRIRDAVFDQVVAGVFFRVFGVHTQENDTLVTVVVPCLFEHGSFALARNAVARPEIDHNRLPAQACQADGFARHCDHVEVVHRDFELRRRAGFRRVFLALAVDHGVADHHDHRQDHHHHDNGSGRKTLLHDFSFGFAGITGCLFQPVRQIILG